MEEKTSDQKLSVNAMDLFRAQDAASKAIIARAIAAATNDGFDNFLTRVGLRNDNALSAGVYTFNNVTRNRTHLEAAYRGSWIVGAVVDSVAEDMTRAGIDVHSNKCDEADTKKYRTAFSRLQIWQSLNDLIKWGRLYGGAIGVLQIEGQDLKTPLILDSVGRRQFRGVVTYDRWQLQPDLNSVIKFGPEMGLPEYYAIVNNPQAPNGEVGGTAAVQPTGQLVVHCSRVIRYIGIQLPYWQAITEQMWGESILERLWDRLIAFDNATMSSGSLIDRACLRTVGIQGLREIIAAGDQAQLGLEKMFDMMRRLQTNEGLTLIDKEDTFQTTQYSFTGLPEMIIQFGQQLSGACGIPLVRLFGQSPVGLNSTGDGEIRMYYDSINTQQESKLRNPFEVLTKVVWRSEFGEAVPEDFEFTFTPLWQMSALDKANIAKTNAETILGAHESSLIKSSTALKELRSVSGDTGIFSNITDEDIADAEAELPLGEFDPVPREASGGVGESDEEEEKPSLKVVPSIDSIDADGTVKE